MYAGAERIFAFDVSETDYLRYTRLFLSGELASSREKNPVRIRLADETEWTRTGRVDFVDNTFAPRSGTIRTRAIVDNKTQLLAPGIFGRVQLFGGEYDALMIPDTAVVSDQSRSTSGLARCFTALVPLGKKAPNAT